MSELTPPRFALLGFLLLTLGGCYQSHEVADAGVDDRDAATDARFWCEPGSTYRPREDCPVPPSMPINTRYVSWNVERHIGDDGVPVEACQCSRGCQRYGPNAPCDNYPGTNRQMTCARRPLPLAMDFCYLPCAADVDCPSGSTCLAMVTPSLPAPEGVPKACLFSRPLE